MKKKIVKLGAVILSCALCAVASVKAQEEAVSLPQGGIPKVVKIRIFKSVQGADGAERIPFPGVKGVILQNNEVIASFETDANGEAVFDNIPEGMTEIIAEDEATGMFGSENVDIQYDDPTDGIDELADIIDPPANEISTELVFNVDMELSENGLSRVSHNPLGMDRPNPISDVAAPPATPAPASPAPYAPPYAPYSGAAGGSGWGALLGLTGLTGLTGIGEPTPVSPSR